MSSGLQTQSESAIERAALAVELRRPVRRPWYRQPWAWGIGGIAIGIAGTLAVVEATAPRQALAKNSSIIASSSSAAQTLADPYALPRLPLENFPALKAETSVDAMPQAELGLSSSTPIQPVESERSVPQPRSTISGSIRPAAMSAPVTEFKVEPVTVSPPVEAIPQKPETVKKPTADEARKRLTAFAQRLGGKIQPVEGGLNVELPSQKAQALASAGEKLGYSASIFATDGESVASPDEIKQRISQLKQKREELLATYYEDAVPVKHLDEDIAAAEAELAKASAPSAPTRSVVRFRFNG